MDQKLLMGLTSQNMIFDIRSVLFALINLPISNKNFEDILQNDDYFADIFNIFRKVSLAVLSG